LHICTLNHFGTVLAKAQHQFVKRVACFSRHLNPREALVRSFFPNFDFADLEIRAMGQNLIQNLGKMRESIICPRNSIVSETIVKLT
jgi:hypothetical protein